MDAVIDTNILYRIAGVMPQGKYSRKKLNAELSKYGKVMVSELSLYELFSRFAPDVRKIRKCLRYIRKTGSTELVPHPIEGFETTEITELARRRIRRRWMFDAYGRVYAKKLYLELRLCRYLVESSTVVFAMVIENGGANLSGTTRSDYYSRVESAIFAMREFLEPQLRRAMVGYYSDDGSGGWLKGQVESIMSPLLFSVASGYMAAAHGIQLAPANQLSKSVQAQLARLSAQSQPLQAIINRMNGLQNQNLVKSIPKSALSLALSQFSQQMAISINQGAVGYYEELVRRILVHGRKIHKNDLIDSEFLRWYGAPSVRVLSLDGPFRNIVGTFDSQYEADMDAFESAVAI